MQKAQNYFWTPNVKDYKDTKIIVFPKKLLVCNFAKDPTEISPKPWRTRGQEESKAPYYRIRPI
jgi:carotenoid cleavage dioxygenase-like enzyme